MTQSYWFQYNTANGTIYPQPVSDTAPASSSSMGVLGPYPVDTADAQTVMAYNYPERFLAQGSPVALVEQPYLTLDTKVSATNANEYTLTATLNNPSATPPTDVTFTVAGQTQTATLTNGQATLTVDLHPSVASASIGCAVSATGCATSREQTIGGSGSVAVALQLYTPTNGNPTVAPIGTGSKSFLESYYALSPASIASLLADIGTIVNVLSDVSFRKTFAVLRVVSNLYQWATALPTNAYVPTAQDQTDIADIDFDADEQNLVQDIVANVLPNVFTTMKNAFPAPVNGVAQSEQTQYAHYVADLQKTFKNFQAYENDLATIPNLA